MKILFVAPYVPSRIRIRPYAFLTELAKRHQVYVIALEEPGGSTHEGTAEIARLVEHFQVIPHSKTRGYCQSLLALPSTYPMCAAYSHSPVMSQAVSALKGKVHFDIVHIEHLRAAGCISEQDNTPIVFDSVDCLTKLFGQMIQLKRNPLSRLVYMRETWSLRRYEPKTLRRFNQLIVTTDSEREELASLDNRLNASVVPNGVDTTYFSPRNTPKKSRRFVFSGKMSYLPNANAAIEFAEQVFPNIISKWPDAEFFIVGSNPPPRVKALEQRPGVRVTGYVSDTRPFLDSSSIAVVPMQVAVGIQNKVLEAMAMGLPVVASSTACRAFGESCPGIIVANSPEEIVQQISRLASNPKLAAETGRSGRERVIRDFSWQSSVSQLESIYEDLLSKTG